MKHPDQLEVRSLIFDKWDDFDYETTVDDIIALGERRWAFSDVIPTGDPLFADAFISLLRSMPKLREKNDIRPSHIVNHWLMNVAMMLPDWEMLRNESTVGDPYAAATGVIPISRAIEAIYQCLGIIPQALAELDARMCELLPQPQEDKPSSESEPQDISGQTPSGDEKDPAEDAPEHLTPCEPEPSTTESEEQVHQELQEQYDDLCEQLEAETPGARVRLSKAMQEVNEELADEEATASAWGLEPGELTKLPHQERMALANKVKGNKQLKKIADLVGVMKPLAFAALRRSVHRGSIEVASIERSGDLSRIMPVELAKMNLDGPLKTLALADFINGQMMSYKVTDQWKEGRGGMVVSRDSSSSMAGQPDIWASALGVVLLLTAKAQNRPFKGIVHGSTGQMKVFDFSDPATITPDNIIDWASYGFMGGTWFEGPLNHSLDWLIADFEARTTNRSDIVFITDGQCQVSPTFQDRFLSELKRIDGRCYGLVIGGQRKMEPLYTLAGGHTWAIRDLSTGRDLLGLFTDVA